MQILRLRSFSRPITTLVLSILLLIVASPTFTSSTEIIANTEEELMEVFRNAKFVEQLDSRTFDATLRKTKYVLVEFYAPWCGHCIQFEPTYRQVAQSFQSFHPDISITVGKVDATKERALASRFNVRGYPSFFLIDGWNVYAYDGPRTRIEMVKWVAETHKNDEPIPFLNSPFGPLGSMKTWLMHIGVKLYDTHKSLVKLGLTEVAAAACMCVVGFVTFVVSIVVIGVGVTMKMKVD